MGRMTVEYLNCRHGERILVNRWDIGVAVAMEYKSWIRYQCIDGITGHEQNSSIWIEHQSMDGNVVWVAYR